MQQPAFTRSLERSKRCPKLQPLPLSSPRILEAGSEDGCHVGVYRRSQHEYFYYWKVRKNAKGEGRKRRKEKKKKKVQKEIHNWLKGFVGEGGEKKKGAINGGVELSLHILPRASHDVSVLAAGTSWYLAVGIVTLLRGFFLQEYDCLFCWMWAFARS